MKTKKLFFLTFIVFTGCLKNVSNESLVQKDGIFFLNNSDKPYTGESFIKSDNNESIFELLYIDGIKKVEKKLFNKDEGLTTVFHQNGNKNTQYEFNRKINHGIKVKGLFQKWYENGQKEFEGTFKDGHKVGLSISWYENGQKWGEGAYKDGVKDGVWTYYYENGKKQTGGTFKNGKEDGLWTWWYENGQKSVEKTYKNGELISEKR